MIKLVTIIGARPQIIKAAALSRAVSSKFAGRIKEVIVHTGQHYDKNMSKIFFDEMGIPKPDYNLGVGSGLHGSQTALMLEKIEEVLLAEKPDFVILFGDTNSTLAGSVAAAKIHIPIVHIEAGLRSFNKSMPEEINRIVCDHTSTLLFTPTRAGLNNLIREGFKPHNKPPYTPDNPGVFHCGDIMYDNSLYFGDLAQRKSDILNKLDLVSGGFVLATIHRDNNTDIPERLNSIFESLYLIATENEIDIVLPVHPRTAKMMKRNLEPDLYNKIENSQHLKVVPPASFFDITTLEKNCKIVMTDSGGVQKEAYFFEKPVIILRPETEWVEIVESGAGKITDADTVKIIEAYNYFEGAGKLHFPPVFGDGKAAEFICEEIVKTAG